MGEEPQGPDPTRHLPHDCSRCVSASTQDYGVHLSSRVPVVIAATVTGLTFHLETVLYEEHHQAFVAAGMLSSAVSLVINFTATTMIVGKLW